MVDNSTEVHNNQNCSTKALDTRIESDSLGKVAVPASAYWGSQTQRAVENFRIGKQKMPMPVVYGIVRIKRAAAVVNRELGLLNDELSNAIVSACDKILAGHYDDQFPVPLWSSGSGTQSNMNVNEVVASIANEVFTSKRGGKSPVHPNDHVNMGQSSNDVFPTAMHLAMAMEINNKLLPSLELFNNALKKKSEEFWKVIKIGRTHMQDAVPLTLGQEFSGYVEQIASAISRIRGSLADLYPLAQGGTAVGSGLNTHPQFAEKIAKELATAIGLPFVSAKNKFAAVANIDGIISFSGALNTLATSVMKIANDIRLLGSGPRCGFGELQLPENEPGSSIMPGKVNPTQCESITMVCAQVMGNNVAITVCGTYGSLELNVFRPCVARNALESIELLADGLHSFTVECVQGIQANTERIATLLNNSLMLVTCLNSKIGYDKAAEIARYAFEKHLSLKEATSLLGFMSEEEFDLLVDPRKMVII